MMAGLLSDVLPFLYSQGDRAKRYLTGLLSDPVGSLEQTAGGLLDAAAVQRALSDKAFANKQRPFQVTDKAAMQQMAENVLAGPLSFAPVAATVWHGSPHKFDKFDSSKIGTGEGAQAYGHGLYFADNKKVAASYKSSLSEAETPVTGHAQMDDWLQYAMGSADNEIEAAQKFTELARTANRNSPVPNGFKSWADFSKQGRKKMSEAYNAAGALYKVDLPDSAIAKMLDWDKPLSQQAPEVQAALNKLPPDVKAHIGIGKYDDLKGGIDIVKPLGGLVGDANVPPMLRQAGIPGIRYLDGGSRGAGQGTSNYVVFPGNEDLLTILERNGIPLR